MDKAIDDALAAERGRIMDKLEAAYEAGDLTENAYHCALACVLIDDSPLTPADIAWAESHFELLPVLQGVMLAPVDSPLMYIDDDAPPPQPGAGDRPTRE